MKRTLTVPLFLLLGVLCLSAHSCWAEGQEALQPGPRPDVGLFPEPWKIWSQQPIDTPLLMQTTAEGSNVNIQVAGQTFNFAGLVSCGSESPTNRFYVSLQPFDTYQFRVSGASWSKVKIAFTPYTPRQLLPRSGASAVPKTFKIFVNGELLPEESLELNFSCGSNDTNMVIEVRPNRGMRPASQSNYEEAWSTDEEQNTAASPGDGQWPAIGPGRSTNSNVGAFRWAVDLGQQWNGLTVGKIRLWEQSISSNLFNGKALAFTARTTNTLEVETLTNANGSLRQIRVPQAFVDLQSTNSPSEESLINFYLTQNVSATKGTNGLYTILTNSPYVTWHLKNPNSPGTYSKLQIIEDRPAGRSYRSEIAYVAASNLWQLSYGLSNETRIETRTVQTTTVSRTETVQIQSPTNIVYKAIENYQKFDWGWELTNVVTNPDSSGLTNTFSYYTGTNIFSFGKLKKREYPGGRWEYSCYPYYDENLGDYAADGWPIGSFTNFNNIIGLGSYYTGGTQIRILPWKDGPAAQDSATLSNVVYSSSYRNAAGTDIHGPSQTWQYVIVNGVGRFISREGFSDGDSSNPENALDMLVNDYRWPDYRGEGGSRVEFSERFRRTGTWRHDLLHTHSSLKFEADLYQYDRGVFTYSLTNDGWASATNGADFLKIKTTGVGMSDWPATVYPTAAYIDWVDEENGLDPIDRGITCVQGKSSQEASVLRQGRVIYTESFGMSGIQADSPVFGLIDKHLKSYDSLGHLTNEVWMDAVHTNISRVVYEANWKDGSGNDTELKSWEIDGTGQKRGFYYDSQKRLTNVTLYGVSASGPYPAQSDISTNTAFNAAGWPQEVRIVGGGLAQTNSTSYDLAGRATVRKNPDTTSVTNTYSADARNTIENLPGGLAKTNSWYLDGRLKSVAGPTVVSEYHDYSLEPDVWSYGYLIDDDMVARVDRVYSGTNLSPRWRETLINGPTDVIVERKPAFSLTNGAPPLEIVRAYDRLGFLSSVTTPTTVYNGAEQTLTETYGYDRGASTPYVTRESSNGSEGRQQLQDTITEFDGADWWSVTRETVFVHNGTIRTNVTKSRLSGFTSTNTIADISITDANGNVTTILKTLDRSAKLVTTVTNTPQSTINITSVVRNGLPQSLNTESIFTATTFVYDGLQREIGQISPLGIATGTLLDSATGWATATTNAAAQVTQIEYYPASHSSFGRPKVVTDASGMKTYYEYNALGLQTRMWGDSPTPEERVYDSAYGQLIELRTFRGGTNWSNTSWPGGSESPDKTAWNYDAATGLLISKLDASNRGYTNLYDRAGSLWTKTLARGVVVTNHWNAFGEIMAKHYSDGTPWFEVYMYNSLGKPWQAWHRDWGTLNFDYDEDGELISSVWNVTDSPLAGLALTNGISSLYGRQSLTLLTNGSPAWTSLYGFDSASGRLSVVSNGVFSASYAYLANSDLVSSVTSKSNGVTSLTANKTWDRGYRLKQISNVVSYGPVTSHRYEYDELDRRTQATLQDGSFWRYGYDARSEVVSGKLYWSDFFPVPGQHFEFAYDNIGNRSSAKAGGDGNGLNLRQTTYAANYLNEYTNVANSGYVEVIGAATATASVTVNGASAYERGEYFQGEVATNNPSAISLALSAIATLTSTNKATNAGSVLLPPLTQNPSYDADGNLTGDGLWTYVWDGENRLASMSGSTNLPTGSRLKLVFSYDYEGKRMSKAVYPWSVATTNWSTNATLNLNYLYDGWNLVAEVNGNSGQTPPTLVRSHTWGTDLSGSMEGAGGVGGLVLTTFHSAGSATNCFAAYDGNGNVTALIYADGTATPAAQYEYSPFGAIIRASGPYAKANPYRFSTKYAEDETGFIYYGYRYYDPVLGRWIGRDLINEADACNLYEFVKNGALHRWDALGLNSAIEVEGTQGVGEGMQGEGGLTLRKIYTNAKEFKQQVEDYADLWNLVMDCVEGDPSDILMQLARTRSDIAGMAKANEHGHHAIPQRMRGLMTKAGVNIDKDKLVKGISAIIHRRLHGGKGFDGKLSSDDLGRKGGMWNFMWRAFMGKNEKADAKAIEAFANRMLTFFGI